LLTFFVALTALAVVTQACVLVAIYLMSKRLSARWNVSWRRHGKLMVPVRAITDNLKAASSNILENRSFGTRAVPARREYGV
jgi:hypothetical protein